MFQLLWSQEETHNPRFILFSLFPCVSVTKIIFKSMSSLERKLHIYARSICLCTFPFHVCFDILFLLLWVDNSVDRLSINNNWHLWDLKERFLHFYPALSYEKKGGIESRYLYYWICFHLPSFLSFQFWTLNVIEFVFIYHSFLSFQFWNSEY